MDNSSLPFTLEQIQVIWYIAFAALLVGYAILDGFDLGVGMLHLFSKSDRERRLMLNSIGPVWDGNEVWLVTAGGALFAGFPDAYATITSSFYLPVMALLGGLIFRAVAIEFRSKQPMSWWRWGWDILFALASLVIAFGFGFVVGNLIQGMPIDEFGNYQGSFLDFFHPYAFLIGALTAALFTMHGCIYILMKTEGEFHDKMREWVNPTIIVFIMLYAISTVATLVYYPHMVETLKERPYAFIIALVNMLAIANIPREVNIGKDYLAFLSSCVNIACLLALYAVGMFPNLVYSGENSVTIWNGSSSILTMHILLLIAVIGIPMVIGYTSSIYYIFRGKVKLDAHSY